jgi:hypothetical protein
MARTLLRKINQYSDEFKATAVGLSSLPGVLMRKHQIRARAARIYRANAGVHRFFEAIPKQRLKALSLHPNAVWVGDITYLKIGSACVVQSEFFVNVEFTEVRATNCSCIRHLSHSFFAAPSISFADFRRP